MLIGGGAGRSVRAGARWAADRVLPGPVGRGRTPPTAADGAGPNGLRPARVALGGAGPDTAAPLAGRISSLAPNAVARARCPSNVIPWGRLRVAASRSVIASKVDADGEIKAAGTVLGAGNQVADRRATSGGINSAVIAAAGAGPPVLAAPVAA